MSTHHVQVDSIDVASVPDDPIPGPLAEDDQSVGIDRCCDKDDENKSAFCVADCVVAIQVIGVRILSVLPSHEAQYSLDHIDTHGTKLLRPPIFG